MQAYIFAVLTFLGIFPKYFTNGALLNPQLSLTTPFQNLDEIRRSWILGGDAHFGADFVHLTHDGPYSQGSLWNINPIIFSDWEIQVQFNIFGRGANLFGNGIAIWFAREILENGPVFGSRDYFAGLGVFIDTFETPGVPHKHNHPYVSAMVNNGSIQYGHDEDGTYMELGGCSANVRNQEYYSRIAVSYSKATLSIYLDAEGIGQWSLCFTSHGVHLPTGYYLGVSASTGEYFDPHEILSITTLDLNPGKEIDYDRMAIIPYAENYAEPKVYTELLNDEMVSEIFAESKPENIKPSSTVEKPIPKSSEKPKPKTEPSQDKPKIKQPEPKPKADPKKEESPKMERTKREEPNKQDTKKNDVKKEKLTDEGSRMSWKMIALITVVGAFVFTYGVKSYKRYLIRKREMMEKRLY